MQYIDEEKRLAVAKAATGKTLSPLQSKVVNLLTGETPLNYRQIVARVEEDALREIPALNSGALAIYVAGLLGVERKTRATNNLSKANEQYVAAMIISGNEAWQDNPKNEFILNMCDALGEARRENKDIANKPKHRGTVHMAAEIMKVSDQCVTDTIALAMTELAYIIDPRPNAFKQIRARRVLLPSKGREISLEDYASQEFFAALNRVAEHKLAYSPAEGQLRRLGRTPQDQERLTAVARAMSRIRSYSDYTNLLQHIPSLWMGEVFMEILPVIQFIYDDPRLFTPLDRSLLFKIASGVQTVDLVASNYGGLTQPSVKTLKNLLIYGKPNHISC